MSKLSLELLRTDIDGELHTDHLHAIIYATDASVYRALPLGVVYPRNAKDIQKVVNFCRTHAIPIIPRAGGTSLAGQCVGDGLVVDVSKYMTGILDINAAGKTVTVQPGVIRDELNHALQPYGLMFGPNTSTANRAMIGGMVGNNSCGSTSIVFGSTRDHVQRLKVILSDGNEVIFEPITKEAFAAKCQLNTLEGSIYRQLKEVLSKGEMQQLILEKYPKPEIKRRNTGYALDALLRTNVFSHHKVPLNLCALLCGSEGTLGIITEITIGLVKVPPENEVLVTLQFASIEDSMRAVPYVMSHNPFACELMDKTILDCTKGQRMYEKDRFFLKGDPAAVLLVSFVADEVSLAEERIDLLVYSLETADIAFDSVIVRSNVLRIWNLRKAGLGLLANLPGDKKAVACIEDTAVAIDDLRAYISEFDQMMRRFGQKSVYYAHAGAGEIHLRPILNLKKKEDRALFAEISQASAHLVKKYKGSLSGEHGDGRVRAPFIPDIYGEKIYQVFCDIKKTWDPDGIFNPGKIVHPKSITSDLRFEENHVENAYDTVFDFSATGGILRSAEKCNGSGDCRKLPLSGGTMCPSYMATRDEKDTTRARANTLREMLTRPQSDNAWNSKMLKTVMDLCLSCKGCTSECPSNVDMSTMKAEFLYHYQKANGIPFRSWFFGHFAKINNWGSKISNISNWVLQNKVLSAVVKKFLHIHPQRSLPYLNRKRLRSRYSKIRASYRRVPKRSSIYLFLDEFTDYNDEEVGVKALKLLFALGYEVIIVEHTESGRAAISKGLLSYAVACANENVEAFHPLVKADKPLVGIEPSAILSFVDEYPKLVRDELKEEANELKNHVFTIESFLYQEIKRGKLSQSQFTTAPKKILLHGHCHQKALTDMNECAWLLAFPENYSVEMIPSGCCGMAGSFGYEKEHYDVSMKIGALVLFPKVRAADPETIVAASGTSCRHQIWDGTQVKAKHSVEILYDALIKK